LRFASVYKGFEDLADFEREVTELQKNTEPKRRR
jgi:transcriptional regulator NrdR family protein